MSVQKQYKLPNCTLLLDGFDDDTDLTSDNLTGQSTIAILANADLKFTTSNQALSGGRVFLENLATAVSNYAQDFLSGLSRPAAVVVDYPKITIEKSETKDLHRIIVAQDPETQQEPQTLDLTLMEFFDLVEVIDQFYTDATVLPDVSLELSAITKRFRKPEEPFGDRVIPLVAGTASLAFAAAALFMIPTPEIKQQEIPIETTPIETVPEQTESSPEE
ncbi:hypothetical protein Xen7305DRAFT_00037700 [Xenococcus sp. PCC 7305]|uniref:DUF4335 domain-containing protein n=1 Tax=Xenococcus sp. PCC 7305 TaxID=102125 RepID=UPI0002AC48A2|nr:DUF4335 domain-containing protein [Xenococcus sp. PCC 7305]ELS04042.1 hypothetical protein Xen7305DRAFT_00037700 [Xenococcus sp. PCC 7305]